MNLPAPRRRDTYVAMSSAFLPTMKLSIAAALILAGSSCVSAQTVSEKRFFVRFDGEAVLHLQAAAPGTSWGRKGSEAAVLTLYVDGRYNQDVTLFAGARSFTYRIVLGPLAKGSHSVRLDLNKNLSAPSATAVDVKALRFVTVTQPNVRHDAIASSPILHSRRDSIGKFSDVPLLMWYETKRTAATTTIRYSIIFSNEDGGTQTDALMARWGRATDIEWLYEITRDRSGRVIAETYQGINHAVREFLGRKEGGHPVLFVASDNNNFSDAGESRLRIALEPIPFNSTDKSREELMDRHPWTYRVMAEELSREGKIIELGPPASALGAEPPAQRQIADPRRYFYIEARCEQRGTALGFRVKLKGDPDWHSSDLGQSRFRIDRAGYFRTAVRLPRRARLDEIERIVVRCDVVEPGDADCKLLAVHRLFLLDESFTPGPSLAIRMRPVNLEPGRSVDLYVKDVKRKGTKARPRNEGRTVDGFSRNNLSAASPGATAGNRLAACSTVALAASPRRTGCQPVPSFRTRPQTACPSSKKGEGTE